MNKKERPVFELFIDGQEFEVDRISIVDEPAVERNFLAFNKVDKVERPREIFEAEGKDYFEVLGVAMVADTLIPRYDKASKTEYDVYFSKDTIRSISQNFFFKGYQHSINLQHSDINVNACAYQSYIVNTDLNMNTPKGIETVPNGSWIVGLKLSVDNDVDARIWKAIKQENLLKGFSIEGYFLNQLTKNFSMENFKVNDPMKQFELEMNAFIKSLNN